MSRRSKTSRSLILLSALTAAVGAVAVRPAHAAAYSYPTRQRTVNAGVLFVGTASTTVANAPDPAPYVFYVLDQRADIKPVGWTFVNPIAPTSITPAITNRWGIGTYSATNPVSQDLAAYWEVSLRDTSSDQLQQFDVLYLPATGANFTPADNEKLRRFVDGGGQLIVEYSAAGSSSFFAGTSWATASGMKYQAPVVSLGVYDLEPLLTQPFFFQPTDIITLQTANPSGLLGSISAGNNEYGNLFGTVLTNGSNPAVAAAQLGAGQIVASTLNIGRVVSLTAPASQSGEPKFSNIVAPSTVPPNPATVPNVTLQLLSNMISWGDAHPTENKTSHQNGAGASAASFAPSWSFPVTGTIPPPGAAVWGNFLYVTDSTGTLHCFDAYPDKDLLGENKLDNGITAADFSAGKAYDEIWNASVGTNASAPTVGTFGGITYVFVENAKGSIIKFPAINTTAGVSGVTYPTKITNSTTYPQAGGFVSTPAPTYYEGRIYAGQPDGTLLVYDLNSTGSAAAGAVVPLDTNSQNANGEYVTAAPAVGLIASGDANTVVATVATNANLYTVLLGGRNDPLLPYSVNGQLLGYNVNRTSRYFLPNLFVDLSSVPKPFAFNSDGNNSVNAGSGQDPVFPITTNVDYYANWDIDFAQSLASGTNSTLTLNEVKALSLQSTASADIMSAPAFGRSGDCYYTVNGGGFSYLFGVHPDIQQRNVRVKFRFRIPTSGDAALHADPTAGLWNYKDADLVDYSPLQGFQFVGAPVVDGQGNVYVAAQGNGKAAILCFNGSQEPTADAPNGYDTTQASYSQPDEGSSGQTNSIIAIPTTNVAAARFGQLSASGNHISVFNFGRIGKQILNNLSEPQPFLTTPNGNQTGAVAVVQNLPFHTNLAWMTAPFIVTGQISGLTKVGNTLMLADSGSPNNLYKFPANPTVGTGKLVSTPPAQVHLGSGAGGYLNIGLVSAAPSAGGGAMVINGTTGIAAFNQQLTLIADNNRILEADTDGNAVWAVDATTRDTSGGTATKVDFAHPTALTQVAPNDYLVADTGNNRCVRFDRAGKVIWELTRFNDPQGLMAPGQPNTLNQPTSVEIAPVIQTFTYPDPVSGKTMVATIKQYLVADTGNNRIVEVTDTTDPNGNILTTKGSAVVTPGTAGSVYQDHILTWVSHTADQYGRRYHYASASYFYVPGATPPTKIAAIVTNTRLAPLTANGGLSAANGDTPGGSIVIFNRPANPQAFSTALPNDLAYLATSFTVPSGVNLGLYQVHNPRFLNVYTPPNLSATNSYGFLYADDNGAFDLVCGSTTFTLSNQALVFPSVRLSYTAKEYRAMTTGVIAPSMPLTAIPKVQTTTVSANTSGIPDRLSIPFVPTCVQRINDDNTFQPRYLITQSFGQAELGTQPTGATAAPKIGGEIFEIDVDVDPANTTFYKTTAVGGFGPGATLSRPGGTGPLTQPTSAIRTPQ